MPIVTRSQSKKMRLKDISEKGDRDSLTKRSLLLSLHEIQLRLIILEEDPENNIFIIDHFNIEIGDSLRKKPFDNSICFYKSTKGKSIEIFKYQID